MSRAFVRDPDPAEPRCPACGGLGEPVGPPTLDAQVPADARAGLGNAAFYCASATCRTAYFTPWGARMDVDRLPALVHPKDPEGTICPCFGRTAAEVVADARDGRKERVKALMELSKGPQARCLERRPDGQPCLPHVLRLFRENFSAP
jgi:hypothetical protein